MKEISHFNGDVYEVLGNTVNTVTYENLVVCRKVQDPVGIIWERAGQKRIERMVAEYVPETNDGDTISRKAALDARNHELRCGAVINQCGLEMAYEVIEDLPSAEPQIIRCKDCK